MLFEDLVEEMSALAGRLGIMLFEDLVEEMGGFGPYQVRMFIVVSLFESPAAWTFILPVFTSAKNPLICLDGNTTIDVCSNKTACNNIAYTNPIENSVISEWNLICDKSYIPVIIKTLQMAGVLLGAGTTGQLADMYGRRIILYAVYTLMLLFSLVSSFTISWPLYAACRALVGFFFGGVMVVNFVMPMEFVGKSWRTFCGCVGFWAVGVMSLPALAYMVLQWRHLTALTAILGLLLLPTYWWIDESPRWLLQKGRLEEAKKIIAKIAVYNNKEVPDFHKISTCVHTSKLESKQKYSYWNIFRTPYMAKNATIIIFCWFVCGSVYYGSTYSIGKLTGSSYLNLFFSGLVEIPALLFVILINNRIGRRWTLCLMMSLAGISYFNILVSLWVGDMPRFIRVTALLGKAGITGAWAAAQIYSAELFPTVVRNIGIASCSMAARVGLITVPKMIDLNKVITFLWCACLTVTAAILSYFLPETLNKCLPDQLPALNWPCCSAAPPSRVCQDVKVIQDEEEEEEEATPTTAADVEADPHDPAKVKHSFNSDGHRLHDNFMNDSVDVNDYDNSHFYRNQSGVESTNL